MNRRDREYYIISDSPLKKDLLRFFRKNERLIILDIGGCEGEDSIRYSRIFPLSKIYVFEPLPYNQKLITENLSKYQVANVELIPCAVSDIEGVSQFYVSSGHPENMQNDEHWNYGNKSSSLLSPDEKNMIDWLDFKEKINVETVTIKKFMEKTNTTIVDFIHMDVQGAELKVLEGAKDNLSKVKAIWLEVSDIKLYENQPLRIEVENFMKDNGFYLYKTVLEGNFGDQLYINKKYFKIFNILNKYKIIQRIDGF